MVTKLIPLWLLIFSGARQVCFGVPLETTTVVTGASQGTSQASLNVTNENATTSLNETSKVKMRIVGGFRADIRDFPYQVMVTSRTGSLCGGSIISKKWILTAAHCLAKEGRMKSAQEVQVAAGTDDAWARGTPIASFHIHPEYDISGRDTTFKHDIALIELRGNLRYSDRVQRVALPHPGEEKQYAGQTDQALVSGFGLTSARGRTADRLRAVALTIWSDRECTSKAHVAIQYTFCAGHAAGGKDSCSGDSGGPLIVRSKEGPVIVGVVSSGPDDCASGEPGLYTRVSYYTKWICGIMRC